MSDSSAILLQNLFKRFGNFEAISDLNLEVFRGDIFGFLGPNGAGKSTSIRMMLSLIRPDQGEIRMFGKNLLQHRGEILKRIGSIIESPDFYLYLTAEKNLELLGKLSGMIPARQKIYELLELVGLKGREKDKVKTFSHGMKQRLGIAQTLIHDPELIILDEPTTGLDPQGIIDVRNLIRRLQNDFGKTVFLSSHLLSEVEQIATHMAIISNGKTVVQGKVTDLLSSQDLVVSIEVDDALTAKKFVNESLWQAKFRLSTNGLLDFSISKQEIPALTDWFNGKGIEIFSVSYKRTLEDYFLNLTNESHRKFR